MITNKNGGQWVESGSKKIVENILEHDDDVKAQEQNILNANTTWKSEFGKNIFKIPDFDLMTRNLLFSTICFITHT